jgi:hypothetical protein
MLHLNGYGNGYGYGDGYGNGDGDGNGDGNGNGNGSGSGNEHPMATRTIIPNTGIETYLCQVRLL